MGCRIVDGVRWIVLTLGLAVTMIAQADEGQTGYQFNRLSGETIHYTQQGWLQADNNHELFPKHFFVTVDIERQRYRFMIDTGASDVFVPYRMAKKLNVECNPIESYTASSTIRSCSGTLTKLDISGILVTDVTVHYPIRPNKSGEQWPLLGMDALNQIQLKYINNQLYLKPLDPARYAPWLQDCLTKKRCLDPLTN